MVSSKKKVRSFKDRIEALINLVGIRHSKKRPENLLSDTFDVEVYAVRQWVTRGIPKKHRKVFADLAGITLKELEDAHR